MKYLVNFKAYLYIDLEDAFTDSSLSGSYNERVQKLREFAQLFCNDKIHNNVSFSMFYEYLREIEKEKVALMR